MVRHESCRSIHCIIFHMLTGALYKDVSGCFITETTVVKTTIPKKRESLWAPTSNDSQNNTGHLGKPKHQSNLSLL
jgi:hypothetical protein